MKMWGNSNLFDKQVADCRSEIDRLKVTINALGVFQTTRYYT